MKRGRACPDIQFAMDPIQEGLLTTREAARLLAISPKTLKWWRSRLHRAGPAFIRVGGRVRYSFKHLQRYLDSRTVRVKSVRGK